jgi:hypothetical protein
MPSIVSSVHPRLYRAIRTRKWITQLSAAFRLRPCEESLSVILSVACTPDVCEAQLGTCFGELVLNTATVIEGGFRVEPDDPADLNFSANHGNVFGLPPHDADEREIEDAASDLADLVVSIQQRS